MQNVDMEVSGSRATIDFARTGLNVETLMERAQEVCRFSIGSYRPTAYGSSWPTASWPPVSGAVWQ